MASSKKETTNFISGFGSEEKHAVLRSKKNTLFPSHFCILLGRGTGAGETIGWVCVGAVGDIDRCHALREWVGCVDWGG